MRRLTTTAAISALAVASVLGLAACGSEKPAKPTSTTQTDKMSDGKNHDKMSDSKDKMSDGKNHDKMSDGKDKMSDGKNHDKK